MTHSFSALGTQWWIEVFDEVAPELLSIIFDDGQRFVAAFEANYSRFKADSLISTLNRERILLNPSDECHSLLYYGKQLYLRSGTRFNFLTGHILEARGYDASYSFTDSGSSELVAGNPISDLLISENEIALTHGNVDLGGFGKGYLVDLVATRLQNEHGLKYFLINAGGDMFATSNRGKSIEITLEHPTLAQTGILKTTLLNQGFAASSPFRRQWKAGEKTQNHIVSKENNLPIATYIKAKTARDADAFATTALMLPEAETLKLAKAEELQVARFSPTTNQLWHTKDFVS